mmetsp:Transcript_29199/g.38401  ORF Transcript_29199/g.38401 Transcript_29199/m.38401 type:complete len:341 (+) Transcript_29199:67-1089(+)
MKVVKASDVAPDAFSTGPENEIDKAEDLEFDLKHLVCFDSHPLDPAALKKKKAARESHLQELAASNVKHLMSKLFHLPTRDSDVGPLAELPPSITVIPREKPLPKDKPETKWQKFAREKGIKNKKRERLVWDEEWQEWRPRFGYKRAGEKIDIPWIELKPGQENSEDPFSDLRAEKKARVAKNLLQNMRNKKRTQQQLLGPQPGIPVDLVNPDQSNKKAKRGKANTTTALSLVQKSTASMGKFDEKRPDEPNRIIKGKRRNFKPLVQKGGHEVEKEGYLKLLNQVLINKGKSKQERASSSKNDLAFYDAIEGEEKSYRKKKGRAGAGKAKKITKKRQSDK